jgi:hypothetical protein
MNPSATTTSSNSQHWHSTFPNWNMVAREARLQKGISWDRSSFCVLPTLAFFLIIKIYLFWPSKGSYQCCTSLHGTPIYSMYIGMYTWVCQNLLVGYVLKYIFGLIIKPGGFFVWTYLSWNIPIKVLKCFILCWNQWLGREIEVGKGRSNEN